MSRKQSAWITSTLRKRLGDAKVAFFIFNHGLPRLLDMPAETARPNAEALHEELLEEMMLWHTALLHDILGHCDAPALAYARRMGSLNEKAWRRMVRAEVCMARLELSKGKQLSLQRSRGKRSYDEMLASEKEILDSWDTGHLAKKLAKAQELLAVPRHGRAAPA